MWMRWWMGERTFVEEEMSETMDEMEGGQLKREVEAEEMVG